MIGRWLNLILILATGIALGASGAASAQERSGTANTPIEHVVTVMQSNSSFDHYFGSYPGTGESLAGICMPVDPTGESSSDCVSPFAMSSFEEDLSHTNTTFQQQYRSGQMDGFISAFRQRGELHSFTMGYYDDEELPFHWNVADDYVLFNRYFSSASAGSTPNRMYWVSGQPGVADLNRVGVPPNGWGDIPTIFDRLEERGISWKFYIENYDPTINFRNRGDGGIDAQFAWAPVLSFARFLDDPELSSHIVDLDEYFTDVANDSLPAVSYVATVDSSEHPPSNPLAGQRLLRSMTTALMQSSAWESSAFMWAYDDWGGWYDHVPPPVVDSFGYGFRVPAMLVSPYARQGYVDSTVLDHTSVLKFIEENWDIPPLAERDGSANSISGAFDFSQPPRAPVIISMSRTSLPGLVIPDRSVIYAVYVAAAVFVSSVIGAALLWGFRPTPRRPRLRRIGARS